MDVQRARSVEESGPLTVLDQARLAHGVLDHHIDDLTDCLPVRAVGVVHVGGVDHVLSLRVHSQSDLSSQVFGFERGVELHVLHALKGPDVEPGVHELADLSLDLVSLSLDDQANLERSVLKLALFLFNKHRILVELEVIF